MRDNYEPYSRFNSEYGAHYDTASHKPAPRLSTNGVDEPDGVSPMPNRRGMGRTSDAYGVHHRSPGWAPPRGGVAVTVAPPESDVLGLVDSAREMRNYEQKSPHAGTNWSARATAGGGETPGKSKGPGSLNYRGDRPEEFGTRYTNGYEFEGYFQGVHAGKDSQSSFMGGTTVPRDYDVDPYANRRAVDSMDHKPLPKHMDMPEGLIANMAPSRRMAAPVIGPARNRVAAYITSEMQQGRGDPYGHRPGAHAIPKPTLESPSPRREPANSRIVGLLVPGGETRALPSPRPGKLMLSNNQRQGGLGGGMVPNEDAAAREGFASRYDDRYAGMDTKSHFGAGMAILGGASEEAPSPVSRPRQRDPPPWGDESPHQQQHQRRATGASSLPHAGMDTKSHFGPGMAVMGDASEDPPTPASRPRHREAPPWGRDSPPPPGAASPPPGALPHHIPTSRYEGFANRSPSRTDAASGVRPGALAGEQPSRPDGVQTTSRVVAESPGRAYNRGRLQVEGSHPSPRAPMPDGGHSGLGPGMVARTDAARPEALPGGFGDAHAGKDTASAFEPGMVGRADKTRREEFAAVYGDAHAHKDTHSNIEAGFVGARDAVSEGIFTEGRVMQHAGKDNESGIGVGMVASAENAQREGFAAAYSDLHAGKDTASGMGAGMVAREEESQREGFAAAYSDLHAGKDTEDNFEPGGWVPRVQWKGGSSAKMAYERRMALQDYYAEAAKGGGYEKQAKDRSGLAAGKQYLFKKDSERPF